MNTIREIIKINEEELKLGIAGTVASWHTKYTKSAWIYVGNLDHTLTEGDIICVLSQYGEIDDIHLIRDDETGTSKGFAFIKYEDSRSCILAVDNFIGIQLCGRSLRVDHVENYRLPKHIAEKEDATTGDNNKLAPGHAYTDTTEFANEFNLQHGQDLFAPPPPPQQQQQQQKQCSGNNNNSIDDNDKAAKKQKRKEEKRTAKKEAKEIRKQRKREKKEKNERRHHDDHEKRHHKRSSKKRNKHEKRDYRDYSDHTTSEEDDNYDYHRNKRRRRDSR